MAEFLPTPIEKARKANSIVLQVLKSNGKQGQVATSLGISDSSMSRLVNDHMEQVIAVLYQAGFKCVTQGKVCVDKDALDFMRRITTRVMSNEVQAKELFEGDE
jgi:hypothetical protein